MKKQNKTKKKTQPFPIYVSKEKFEDCVNLLLITEGEISIMF